MNFLSRLWLNSPWFFEPVQRFFNGNFWEVFVKKFGKFEGKKVLDLGSGTGELRVHITPKFYLGIDINSSFIKFAQKRFKDKNTRFLCKDVRKFYPDSKFDVVFIVGVQHHLSRKGFRDVLANIKKIGTKKLIITEGYPIRFKKILLFLDRFLGESQKLIAIKDIERDVSLYFDIEKRGTFYAKKSFYFYPFFIAGIKTKDQK